MMLSNAIYKHCHVACSRWKTAILWMDWVQHRAKITGGNLAQLITVEIRAAEVAIRAILLLIPLQEITIQTIRILEIKKESKIF